MDINPNVSELRQRLGEANIPYKVEDDESEYESGFFFHTEKTSWFVGEREVIVTWSWYRDPDERKKGDSYGWPAYMELMDGEEKHMVTADEALSWE